MGVRDSLTGVSVPFGFSRSPSIGAKRRWKSYEGTCFTVQGETKCGELFFAEKERLLKNVSATTILMVGTERKCVLHVLKGRICSMIRDFLGSLFLLQKTVIVRAKRNLNQVEKVRDIISSKTARWILMWFYGTIQICPKVATKVIFFLG